MKKEVLLKVGANVRRMREKRGYSQMELAEKSDSHINYIGGVERGERNATAFKLYKIAQALGCKPSLLFKGL